MKKAKKCINCKYRSNVFYLSPKREGLPHCHCNHPDISEAEFGWGTLQEAFWSCVKFAFIETINESN